MFFLLFCFFFAQTNCRGAAQFLLCRNATSRLSTFRLQYHLYFSTQCLAQKIYNIVCFFSFVTNPSPAASMSGCRGRQPLHICVYSLSTAKSLRSLRILLCIRNYKSGAEICSPTPLCFGLQLCTSSFIILHRLVGLRRMRLCPFLVSEVEQEIYSDMGFAP
mgnify:CR=1 FL=1